MDASPTHKPHIGDTHTQKDTDMKIKFTGFEWSIIAHRLGAPDAIAEALTDGDDEFPPVLPLHTEEQVTDRANGLLRQGPGLINWDSKLDKAIVEDCCNGSTFFADMDDEVALGNISKGTSMNYHKAANHLERLLQVEIPRA